MGSELEQEVDTAKSDITDLSDITATGTTVNNIVHKDGTETITGQKSMTNVNNDVKVKSTPVETTSAVNQAYVESTVDGVNNIVHKSGNEEIAGTKTLTSIVNIQGISSNHGRGKDGVTGYVKLGKLDTNKGIRGRIMYYSGAFVDYYIRNTTNPGFYVAYSNGSYLSNTDLLKLAIDTDGNAWVFVYIVGNHHFTNTYISGHDDSNHTQVRISTCIDETNADIINPITSFDPEVYPTVKDLIKMVVI